jgi:hypothetical protein
MCHFCSLLHRYIGITLIASDPIQSNRMLVIFTSNSSALHTALRVRLLSQYLQFASILSFLALLSPLCFSFLFLVLFRIDRLEAALDRCFNSVKWCLCYFFHLFFGLFCNLCICQKIIPAVPSEPPRLLWSYFQKAVAYSLDKKNSKITFQFQRHSLVDLLGKTPAALYTLSYYLSVILWSKLDNHCIVLAGYVRCKMLEVRKFLFKIWSRHH